MNSGFLKNLIAGRRCIAPGEPGAGWLLASVVLIVSLFSAAAIGAQARQAGTSQDLQQIQSLMQQNRMAEAKTATLDVLHRDPKNVEAYNLLGMILGQQRDSAGAVASFQKALQIDPGSVKTHNNLGSFLLMEKQVDQAEKEFRAVLRLDPANRDANYNLGVLLMVKGDSAGAILHFKKVKPADSGTRLQLVHAYFQNKQPALALETANQLSASERDNVPVHFSLGVLLGSEKQYDAARLELEKADALQPGTFEILYNLGEDLLLSGHYDQAGPVLDRALRLQPDSPDALYLKAQVLDNESRPLDALNLLVRARKLAPENLDILFLMAQVSMSQGYYEDAIPVLEAGLKIDPKRSALVATLGQCYFLSGKTEKAIEVFNKLIEVDHSARSYAFLGMSYRNLGRYDDAKNKFQLGLQLDPKNSLCLFNLGFIAERQGDGADAEKFFQKALEYSPDFADPLLELANLKTAAKKPQEAEELLRHFVRVSRDPATGYYKLAMLERSLHEMDAANRDLESFKSFSKHSPSGSLPYQNLFEYLDNRSHLAGPARDQLDVEQLSDQVKKNPDQPEDLYFLAETYFKLGKMDEAQQTIAQLDQASADDYRMLTGVGVLLARYRLYQSAIEHLNKALEANMNTDEVRFDLADTYFRARRYQEALDAALQVSAEGQKDDAYLALLGDIYAHMGDSGRASAIFRDAISRNPDNDQDYLSLAMIQLRGGDVDGAKRTLEQGRTRIPGSGKLFWGMGLVSVMEGHTADAADQLERAVDLLPEWPGGYSTLGVFYFENGEIAKAREVFDRFKNSDASGSLPADQIERTLASAEQSSGASQQAMNEQGRAQFLQWALLLADRTL
jgi:tetratricopeptide (TPR) repeat protein